MLQLSLTIAFLSKKSQNFSVLEYMRQNHARFKPFSPLVVYGYYLQTTMSKHPAHTTQKCTVKESNSLRV